MLAVEDDQRGARLADLESHAIDGIVQDRVCFDKRNSGTQRMRFDGCPVVRADFYIDADNPSLADGGQELSTDGGLSTDDAGQPIVDAGTPDAGRAHQTLEFHVDSLMLHSAYDHKPAIVSPRNGVVSRWTREDGEEFSVSSFVGGDSVMQTFHAKDGQRENRQRRCDHR